MIKGRSARQFSLDLSKFGKVTAEQATLIFRKIAFELDSAVVLGTPVDVGRARGNWYPSISIPSGEINEETTDKNGDQSLARIQGLVLNAKLGQVVWLTNNLPYILPLENGSSKQAPRGMVDINVERVAAQYGGRIER
jgi:hypothetical protein